MKTDKYRNGFKLNGTNNICILFLHGFSGTSAELYPAASYLNKYGGYNCVVPTAIGHGGKMEDLLPVTDEDIKACALKYYDACAKKYDKVYIIGHSMGGLLACYIAQKRMVAGIILYNPCLEYNNKLTYLIPLFSPFKKCFHFGPCDLPDDTKGYLIENNGFYLKTIKLLNELMFSIRHNMSSITCPILIISANNDKLISNKANLKYISKTNSTYIEKDLYDGTHLLPLEKNRELVFSKSLDFIKHISVKA